MSSARAGLGRRFWLSRSGRGNVRPLDDHPARGTLPMYKRQGRRRFPVTEVIRATVGAGQQRPPLLCQPGLVCFPKRTVKACLDFLPTAAVCWPRNCAGAESPHPSRQQWAVPMRTQTSDAAENDRITLPDRQ